MILSTYSTELKEKLNQETDASRQLALRKELDAKAYQDRLDKLVRLGTHLLYRSVADLWLFADRRALHDSRSPHRRHHFQGAPRATRRRPRHSDHGQGGEARHLRGTRQPWC